MKINGYELNLTEEKLDDMISRQLRNIELITPSANASRDTSN